MHEFWLSKESIFSEDSVLKLQAGKLDTSKADHCCGYSLIELHEKNILESGEIHFRRYDVKKSKFRSWDERMDNGKASYSLIDALPFDRQRFSIYCKEVILEIEYDLLCNTGLLTDQRKKLSEIFVLPALAIENDEGITENSFEPKPKTNLLNQYFSINSLSDSPESLIVLGSENSGKSTLAKRLSLHYLTNQAAQNLENIVFYLDLKGKSYTKIEKKLSSNGAVIIFDSIESLDPPNLKIIFEYISTSVARFFIFGQLSARPSLRDMSLKISDKKYFRYLNIKSLKRNNLKELVRKWSPSSTNIQSSKVATNALKIVSSTGMANNPFVFTMLLSIHERKAAAFRTYMHEADLVENFIEIIMEKHVIPSGNVPQYKDVLLFLGYVADHMHEVSNYSVSDNELTQKALDFNKLIDQTFKVDTYIEPILKSGIMRKEADRYRFSQICFFNYVFANWISKQGNDYSILGERLDFMALLNLYSY